MRHLDDIRGDLLPPQLAATWRPFALASRPERSGRGNAATLWELRGLAAALRLVDAGTLDSFRPWREALGDSINTATTRVYAVRVFLALALRAGVLTETQGHALGLRSYRQRQKRDEKPVGRRLTPAEVCALRKAVAGGPNTVARDRVILDAMLYAGLRRAEHAGQALVLCQAWAQVA